MPHEREADFYENTEYNDEYEREPPANSSVPIDARLAAVSDVIVDVLPPGDFATHGIRTVFPLPWLHVNGLGVVSPPLAPFVARELIAQCHLAPYGSGEKTLIDTSVRNTWELNTTQIKIDNPAWQSFVDGIVDSCHVSLGIPPSTAVAAKLYKLLLYEAGGKFDRHQDSEKERGMFGTLVVVLPGVFTGGELVVHDPATACATTSASMTDQDDQPVMWDAASMDPFAVKYAAFYGDCPHEVMPVKSGYRLCLTYNLVTIVNDGNAAASEPKYGENLPSYAKLKTALSAFFTESATPPTATLPEYLQWPYIYVAPHVARLPFELSDSSTHRDTKLVYVLSHKYTEAGLSIDFLKNKDALVASSLMAFCRDSDGAFELYLTKMMYKFEWTGPEDQLYGGDENKLGIKEHIYRTVALPRKWLCCASSSTATGATITVRSENQHYYQYTGVRAEVSKEVAPVGFFSPTLDYDAKEDRLWTGNEGSSHTKWYASAALVLIPVWARVALQFVARPTRTLVHVWLPLVDTQPTAAKLAAVTFGRTPMYWKIDAYGAVLDGVARLRDIASLRGLLQSCIMIRYQPKLQSIVRQFDWADVAAMIKAVIGDGAKDKEFARRRAVNLVTSCLGTEAEDVDANTIAMLLAATPLQRSIEQPASMVLPPAEIGQTLTSVVAHEQLQDEDEDDEQLQDEDEDDEQLQDEDEEVQSDDEQLQDEEEEVRSDDEAMEDEDDEIRSTDEAMDDEEEEIRSEDEAMDDEEDEAAKVVMTLQHQCLPVRVAEYTRLLCVVLRRAPRELGTLLWSIRADSLVRVVSPSLRSALNGIVPDAARPAVVRLHAELVALAPTVFNATFYYLTFRCPSNPRSMLGLFGYQCREMIKSSCPTCNKMDEFLKNESEKAIAVDKAYVATHDLGPLLTVAPSAEGAAVVVVEKTYKSRVYTAFCREIRELEALLAA